MFKNNISIFIIRLKSKGEFIIFVILLLWGLSTVIFHISLSDCKFSVCVISLLHDFSPIVI